MKTVWLTVPVLLVVVGCGGSPDEETPNATAPVVETVQQAETGFYQELSWSPDGSTLLLSILDWGSGPGGFVYRIHEIGTDGSGFRPLTDGPRDRWTSWSPDGARVAFASVQAENDDIYTMNIAGSDRVRLTDDPAVDSHPQFSPDGSRIAFVSRRAGEAEVYLMNADGSDQKRLLDTEGEPNNPTWSPDGSRLAFFATDADGLDHIWVVNADGTGATRIAEGVWPSWSADGSRVLYGGEDGLYEIDPAGTQPSLILPGEVKFARVSPGGSRLAYVVSDSADVSVHISYLDGSEPAVLLRRPKPEW